MSSNFRRIDHTYENLTCMQTSEKQVEPSCVEQRWRSLKREIFHTFNFCSLRRVQKLAKYEIFLVYGSSDLNMLNILGVCADNFTYMYSV